MFAENISLRDWDITAVGKEQVVTANRTIFTAVETIEVTPIHLYQEGQTVIAELEILIDDTERLLVIDVLQFDRHGKIESIRAYKG